MVPGPSGRSEARRPGQRGGMACAGVREVGVSELAATWVEHGRGECRAVRVDADDVVSRHLAERGQLLCQHRAPEVGEAVRTTQLFAWQGLDEPPLFESMQRPVEGTGPQVNPDQAVRCPRSSRGHASGRRPGSRESAGWAQEADHGRWDDEESVPTRVSQRRSR